MGGIDQQALAKDLSAVKSLIELIEDILRRDGFRPEDVDGGVRPLMMLLHPRYVLALRNVFGPEVDPLTLDSQIVKARGAAAFPR
ncbi:MAG TPA: hypothetical protein VEK15_08000 [Vicinamibacteria bacterium]|nr:hypothetical protein [Vicinamibacteria bacterium]